jgi:hypothetical protein
VLGSSAALFTADGWAGAAKWNVLIFAIGAVVVRLKANTPTQPLAKLLVGLLVAGAAVLSSAWTDGRIDAVEVQQIVLAVLGAASVWAAQNGAASAPAEHVYDADIHRSA